MCRPLVVMEYRTVLKRWANGLRARELDVFVRNARDRISGPTLNLFPDVAPRNDKPGQRRFLLELGDELLWDHLLKPPRIVSVRFTTRLVTAAMDEMVEYGLDANDAVHLAVARASAARVGGPPHIATIDSDFEKVDGLHVWGRR